MDPTQTPQAMAAALMQGGGAGSQPAPTPEQIAQMKAMQAMGQTQMNPAMQQTNPLSQPMPQGQQQAAMPLNMNALMQQLGGAAGTGM